MLKGFGVAALVAPLLLVGCNNDPDPFPYAITSLAVLPTEVTPSVQLAGQMVGDHLTRTLQERTLFRVVGIGSTNRILSQPDGIALYQRFRSLATTASSIGGPLARTFGDRMGVGGLLFPRLALSLAGPASGSMGLTVTVYDTTEGQRVWQGYAQHTFSGHPGEPAFNKTLALLVQDIVTRMPRPAGEVEQ